MISDSCINAINFLINIYCKIYIMDDIFWCIFTAMDYIIICDTLGLFIYFTNDFENIGIIFSWL